MRKTSIIRNSNIKYKYDGTGSETLHDYYFKDLINKSREGKTININTPEYAMKHLLFNTIFNLKLNDVSNEFFKILVEKFNGFLNQILEIRDKYTKDETTTWSDYFIKKSSQLINIFQQYFTNLEISIIACKEIINNGKIEPKHIKTLLLLLKEILYVIYMSEYFPLKINNLEEIRNILRIDNIEKIIKKAGFSLNNESDNIYKFLTKDRDKRLILLRQNFSDRSIYKIALEDTTNILFNLFNLSLAKCNTINYNQGDDNFKEVEVVSINNDKTYTIILDGEKKIVNKDNLKNVCFIDDIYDSIEKYIPLLETIKYGPLFSEEFKRIPDIIYKIRTRDKLEFEDIDITFLYILKHKKSLNEILNLLKDRIKNLLTGIFSNEIRDNKTIENKSIENKSIETVINDDFEKIKDTPDLIEYILNIIGLSFIDTVLYKELKNTDIEEKTETIEEHENDNKEKLLKRLRINFETAKKDIKKLLGIQYKELSDKISEITYDNCHNKLTEIIDLFKKQYRGMTKLQISGVVALIFSIISIIILLIVTGGDKKELTKLLSASLKKLRSVINYKSIAKYFKDILNDFKGFDMSWLSNLF